MEFNINEVIAKMGLEIKNAAAEQWKELQAVTTQFLQNRKARLELLAHLRISGDITQERFLSRLEDEKLFAEAEFNSIEVISKATAQKAANAAIQVLEDAVQTALDTVL